MDKADARNALIKLVNSYVLSLENKDRLTKVILNEDLDWPPVRFIVDEVIKNRDIKITKEDAELIDDLMYFFG